MKRLGFLVVLAAIALGLYNTWQISQMREELSALHKRPTSVVAAKPAEPSASVLLADAQEHGARAKRLLRRGDSKAARVEMQKSLEALREAEEKASAQTNNLRGTFQSVREKLEDVLGQFNSEKPGKASTEEASKKK